MVGPTARISGGIDVLAAKEISLHIHLLDSQLAFFYALVDPLMTRIEAAHVPAHCRDAGLLGDTRQGLGILKTIGHRDLDQNVLNGTHRLIALTAVMHVRRD